KPTAPSATPSTAQNSDILYFRDKNETASIIEKTETAPAKSEPEPAIIERKVEGLKIVGKIDLDKKPSMPTKADIEKQLEEMKILDKPKAEKPEPVKPPVVEPPAKVEKKAPTQPPVQVEKPTEIIKEPAPTPVVEKLVEKPTVTEPIVEVAEPVKVALPPVVESKEKPAPVVAETTEKPAVEAVKEVVKETKQEVKEVKANIATPNQPRKENNFKQEQKTSNKEEKVVKPQEPTEEAKPEEIELIKATGEKLQGLKVLGKIQLPVERESNNDGKKKRKRKRVKRTEKVSDFPQNGAKTPVKDGNNANQPRGGNTQGANTAPANTNAAPKPAPANKTQQQAKPADDKNKHKKDKNKKEAVTESDVKDSIKQTMARMNQTRGGSDFGAKYRKEKRNKRAEQEERQHLQEQEDSQILKVTEYISAAELASMMDVSVNQVIGKCMQMGMFISINQRLDAEAIQMIALEFDYDVEFISAEEELLSDSLEIKDAEADLKFRAPIVTIMGHVDHGKTSLLDYIRRTKVAAGEAGGITQHIGAYSVKMKEGENKGKMITFLDTPGHEAFTAMRARGAKITDIAVVVVAADDSVMPQTREAINHAQNAGVPIVFAINKIDKPGANPQKIREDLSQENILVESWGGKFQEQEVSAKKGIGIEDLLDKVILEAEMLELKANPNRRADGSIIEAALDKGRGYVATVLVQNGTLKVGDIVLAGQYYGRVRAMVDDMGNRIKEAGPSTPVQILGLPGAPQAGDKFNVMETDREAREIANKREQINREQSIRAKKHITLDEIGRRKAIGSFQELNVIVKGDVDGSVEALSDSLLKLSTDEIQVRIIHKGVGQISESDILLASAADAILIGFQVRPSMNARKLAEQEEIEVRLYSVIYDAINELKAALEGMLAPKEEEVIVGNVEIRETFKISKVGTIAGCYVLDGYVKRNNKVRIIRDGIVTYEGEIQALKRYKDDVSEVKAGYECGLSIKNFNDIQVGDIVESFEIREIKRKL
ncbi:MAG: translation initiation factor IF-2, partial [Ignavibacteriaceae bacterium]|nr:translation initiation factor IF-2 [Ignavibacteriaceae bacterium]